MTPLKLGLTKTVHVRGYNIRLVWHRNRVMCKKYIRGLQVFSSGVLEFEPWMTVIDHGQRSRSIVNIIKCVNIQCHITTFIYFDFI